VVFSSNCSFDVDEVPSLNSGSRNIFYINCESWVGVWFFLQATRECFICRVNVDDLREEEHFCVCVIFSVLEDFFELFDVFIVLIVLLVAIEHGHNKDDEKKAADDGSLMVHRIF